MLKKGQQGAYYSNINENYTNILAEYIDIVKHYPKLVYHAKWNFENQKFFYIFYFTGIIILVIFLILKILYNCTNVYIFDYFNQKKKRKFDLYFVESKELKSLKKYLSSNRSKNSEAVFFDEMYNVPNRYSKIKELFPKDFEIDENDENLVSKLFGGECLDCYVDLTKKIVELDD